MTRKYQKEAEKYLTVEDFLDDVNRMADVPDREWLHTTFKSKSAIIRYLRLEKKLEVGEISKVAGIAYRHVYSVVKKADKQGLPTHVCPVCHNRKG